MAQRGGGADGLTLQLQAARAMAPGLEVQQLKASVRARLFGIVDTPPTLGGYTIVRLIGRGGMGAVYEARDERGEVVALKALRGCEPAALYRFKHEFRALSDLVHPNLALLYSLVVAGDQAFLTMERIDGVDFLAHVHAGGPDELALRVREGLRQLVDGLSALHAAGKLHRDVKPSNVLVTREGRVVILDFGLVQELAGAATPGGEALAGTPAYMAPELLTGGIPSTASDWYSVGVMLYEALTSELPFVGGTSEILRDKCERDPMPPELRRPGADPTLSRLCAQLLTRDPLARPDRRAIVAALAAVGAELSPGTGGHGLSPGTGGHGLSPGTGDSKPSPGTGASVPPPAAPLVGRQDELEALGQAFAGVRAGQPAVVLLRGGSGVGKTALVDSFLPALRAAPGGAVILRGRCHEREQVPHNAFDGLVDALAGHLLGLPADEQAAASTGDVAALARLFPGLGRLPGMTRAAAPEDAAVPDSRWRERAYAAFKALLTAIGARGPVVLHIDDLHWADTDSATLLAALVAAPAPPCLLIASYRAGASGPPPVVQGLLQQLRGGGARLWELTIEPLTLTEAERLARALLGAGAAAASAAVVARESAGIPLFVHELAHDVLGCISSGSGAWPARLEDLISVRVGRLPEAARDMLEVLAIAARPLPHGLVIELVGRPAAGRAALQTLSAARLVRVGRSERGEQVEVYHDRIRETVLASLDAARERDCHRRLAAAILACPAEALGEPEILAHHLHAAGDPEGARQHMITAAAQASASLAFARAAELSLAAIRLCPADDLAGRQALRLAAAQALLHAGNHADAAACLLAAADESPTIAAMRLRQRAAEVLLSCGAAARGVSLLQEVLRALGRPLPRTHLARVARVARHTIWLRRHGLEFTPCAEADVPEEVLLRLDTLRSARLAVVNVDPLTSRMYQLEHLRQCLEVGEPRRIVSAIASHGAYLSHAGTVDALAAARMFDQARAIAERHGVQDGPLLSVCEGLGAFNVGAWRRALQLFTTALAETPAGPGAAMVAGLSGLWAQHCSFYLGELRELEQRRLQYLELLRAAGDRASEGRLGVSMQVFAALAADDPARAAQELTATLQRWPRGGFVLERAHAFLAARAIDVYSGDGPRAWARCEDRWPAFTRSYLFLGQHGRVLGLFWRGAAALLSARCLGERGGRAAVQLRRVADASARTILDERARWADPFGHLLRAAILGQSGRDDRAQAALAVAIAGLDGAEMRLWAAAARWQAARLAGDPGRCLAQEQAMAAEGVVAPRRMAATLVPGFAP